MVRSEAALRVVVVGGTGFVGRSVVARLATRGDDVDVLARDVEAAARRFGPDVRVLAWSLEQGQARAEWTRVVGLADCVVNLSGAGVMDRAWTDARRRELFASRVDVTRAVAEAFACGAGRADQRERERTLVSASAVGIYGMHADDELLTEDSPQGSGFLADLCRAWEEAAAPARDAAIRVVHPRLGIVLGASGGALVEMARPFRLHSGGPIGSGAQWMSWIHERDVVQALELALTSSSLRGACNFVAPNAVTMADEAQAIAAVLGTHARLRVPAIALKAILGPARAEVLLTGQRVSPTRLLRAGYEFAFAEIRPALQDLLGRK